MSESAIRAQIKTILEGVSGIGKVHDYARWSSDWNQFITLFKTQIGGVDQIRGWMISRASAKERQETMTFGAGTHLKTHNFLIRGFLGFSDANATEKTFNTLIEAIATGFRILKTLNDTARHHDGIQAETIDARIFGSVLCHYAELNLTVYEKV